MVKFMLTELLLRSLLRKNISLCQVLERRRSVLLYYINVLCSRSGIVADNQGLIESILHDQI